MGQDVLSLFSLPLGPEHPSCPARMVLDISRPVVSQFLTWLASLDSVPPSLPRVHPVISTCPPNSPLENSSPKCFLSRGSCPLSLIGRAIHSCTVLNSEDTAFIHTTTYYIIYLFLEKERRVGG